MAERTYNLADIHLAFLRAKAAHNPYVVLETWVMDELDPPPQRTEPGAPTADHPVDEWVIVSDRRGCDLLVAWSSDGGLYDMKGGRPRWTWDDAERNGWEVRPFIRRPDQWSNLQCTRAYEALGGWSQGNREFRDVLSVILDIAQEAGDE